MLRDLIPAPHADLLVGTETGDDAAVWRVDDRRALVLTADFITPIVDDPRTWGRIAAANSVSDVYAMGGRPLLALNLVAWNTEELPTSLLGEVLAGAGELAAECGYVTAGGHTVDDPEPKFGLSVVGEADPARLLTNRGLRPGDALVLTKALGTGVITTAVKRGGTVGAGPTEAAVASMDATNEAASRVALRSGAQGATDVTGFGFLGHLCRMAEASAVDVDIDVAAVAVLPGARELAADGIVPGGTRNNLAWVRDRVDSGGVDPTTLVLLADAQTSGGLVFGVEADRAAGAVDELLAAGVPAAVVGSVEEGTGRARLR